MTAFAVLFLKPGDKGCEKLHPKLLGRDNYNGYMSINGADTAMFFYTIIESCKLIKLNPRKYLSDMARRHWNTKELITPFE
jgi:hypothetical protein